MEIKHVKLSPYYWLKFRIRIPCEYKEKLEVLCRIYKYRTIDRFIRDVVFDRIKAEQDVIDERRQQEIPEEKRIEEYWKLRWGK